MTSIRSDLRRRAHAAGGVVIALTLGLALAGCASDAEPEAPALDPSIQLPPQNRELWVLPIDEYVPSLAQHRKETFLRMVLAQECLAERGMSVPVPRPSFDDGGDRGVRDRFTPEIAAAYGYRSPLSIDGTDTSNPWIAYQLRPVSDEYIAAEQDCYDTVDIPEFDGEMLNYALTFSNAALVGALSDDDVLAAAAEWRTCMSGLGIEDLPETPYEMPSESLAAEYGVYQTPDAGDEIVITAEEREMAVTDANCRETSGYAEAFYQANWDRQVRLLAENATGLKEMGERIDEVDAALTTAIAEHAQPGT